MAIKIKYRSVLHDAITSGLEAGYNKALKYCGDGDLDVHTLLGQQENYIWARIDEVLSITDDDDNER